MPALQVNPDSPFNTDTVEFDGAVHNPLDDKQEDQDEGGTSMAIAEPSYHERGSVSAVTSAICKEVKVQEEECCKYFLSAW
jgi:hypothetical protein